MSYPFRCKMITTVGLLSGLLLVSSCDQQGSVTAPQNAPPEVGIITIQPQRTVLTTELPGRVAPHLVAEVRPQVGGIIQQRLFTEGSDVKAGQVLYQIDPATYRAAFASAKAALARAVANLAPARLREERFQDLVKIRAVSQQEYDDANAAFLQAEAEVESAKAAMETARIDLDYTSVKAPISGRIGRSTVTTGALVTANQAAALATIQQLDPVYVDITQSTADLLRLKQSLASGVLKNGGPGQAAAGGRYPLPAGRHLEIFRGHCRPEHRFSDPAQSLSQSRAAAAAGNVRTGRAGRGGQRAGDPGAAARVDPQSGRQCHGHGRRRRGESRAAAGQGCPNGR